jgi:hypothetical protein
MRGRILSDPIGFSWKMSDSDEIRLGSDRFRLDLQIGLDHLGMTLIRYNNIFLMLIYFHLRCD